MKRIVLASKSERRRKIFAECGIDHIVCPSEGEELADCGIPISELVIKNAQIKAMAVKDSFKEAVIIGADTLVECEGEILGKPKSEHDARKVLIKLSGGKAEVYTGLFVTDTVTGRSSSIAEISLVFPAELAKEEFDRFFSRLGPYDKAGGFSIEGLGGMVFDEIRGSYFNILGMPLMALKGVLKDIGIDILDFVKNADGK